MSTFSCVVLDFIFLVAITSAVLYVNCSNVAGFEIIPKSRALCHDLYQFLQTGQIWPLTWDIKASLVETIHIIGRSITSVFVWFKNFDLVAVKDSIVSSAIAIRDGIFGFPAWIYGNGGQIFQLVAKLFWELLDFVKACAVWAFYGFLYAIVFAFEWVKTSIIDVFGKIPVYWEKMKDSWAK